MNDNNEYMPLCLLGKAIEIPYLGKLYPLTIDEIFDIGINNYNRYLSILTLTTEDIIDMMDIEIEEKIDPFDFILLNSLMNNDFKKEITSALSCLFKNDVDICEEGYFYLGHINDCKMINIANYGMVTDVIKYQYCLPTEKQDALAKTDKQKEFQRKLKKLKLKYNKYNKNDINLEISNIISSICAKHPTTNVLNVGKLTMYQLIDQFKRLNMIDEYFMNINAMIHGASQEDVQIKHWASTIIND